MKTVSHIDTQLSPFLGVGGQTYATTTLKMLNHVLPDLYAKGHWKALKVSYEVDVSAGYFCLPYDYSCVLTATMRNIPMPINSFDYQTEMGGPGELLENRPVGYIYGLVDGGYTALMSDIGDDGCDELIFTCASASFANGDTAKITYTDTEEGFAEVTLPLETITTTVSAAANGGTDSTTGEVLTTLTVASSTGLVAGLGVALTQLTGTDATYISTFRIHSVVNGTSIKIVKSYVALTGTLTLTASGRLMPVSTIESVESLVYTGLPGRTMVKDADGIIYAILPAGDGVSQFRRYECPQVPEDADDTDDWTVKAIVKRAFIPLTATTDIVYLDNIPALKEAFLAVIAGDAGDMETQARRWASSIKILSEEVADGRGGVVERLRHEVWGEGVGPLPSRY